MSKENRTYDLEERLIDFAVRKIGVKNEIEKATN
jgi:hypothetical protein